MLSNTDDGSKVTKKTTQHDAMIYSMAVLPGLETGGAVCGLSDGTIELWEEGDRKNIAQTNGPVWAVVASHDLKHIVSGGDDGRITIWDVSLTVRQKIQSAPSRARVTALDMSPDSGSVASGSNDGELSVWNITSGERLVGPLAAHSNHQVRCIQFSPRGDRIATVADGDTSLRIWNSLTGELLLDVTERLPLAVVWLSDEQVLVASETRTQCLDVSTGSTLASCPKGMSQLSISHGRTMVAGCNKRDVCLWDADTLSWGPCIVKPDYEPRSVVISIGGILVGGGNQSSLWTLEDLGLFVDLAQGFVHDANLVIFERFITEFVTLFKLQASSKIAEAYSARAIIRSRMKKWVDALHDADMAIETNLPKEGYISKSIVLCYQGNYEDAMRVADLALLHADSKDETKDFLLIKAVLVFLSGHHNAAISRVEDLVKFNPNHPFPRSVLAQMLLFLAEAAVNNREYDLAIDLLTRVGDPGAPDAAPSWMRYSTITGWNLRRVRITVHRRRCEVFLAAGHPKDATDSFCTMMNALEKEMTSPDETEWIADFKSRCLKALEQHGDAAIESAAYEDAIAHYTKALSLNPSSTNLLSKRSKARVGIASWDEALEDADAVIKLNPSSPCGYERRHAALLSALRFDDAIEAYNDILLKMEQSSDPIIRESRNTYVGPSQTKATIRKAVRWAQRDAPLVLINTETGRLCDEKERAHEFEADPRFKELIASMTTKIDDSRIRKVVKEYFRYATFSHTWEGAEPLFHDVLQGSVQSLAESPTALKLVTFCAKVQEAGLRWAWCDTCCINKMDGPVLQESLTSMFQWYHESALTIVHLKGVLSDAELGALERSIWNTRAWTLQEFFASRVIQFYTEDWKPYLSFENAYNHKDSTAIMEEMARANGVNTQVLLSLRPGSEDIRQKLCLAAARIATKQEDIAYSLFGIFDVSIPVTYGEGQQRAVGRLLQEVLTRSEDVTILAWTGKGSEYNSCLPAEMLVYREGVSPHVPSLMEDGEMDMEVVELRTSSGHVDSVVMLYDRVVLLPSPRLASRRLSLCCIMFPLRGQLVLTGDPHCRVYRGITSGLGNVEIKTREDLSGHHNMVLVHPWLKCLLDPALHFEELTADDDSGSELPLTPVDGDDGDNDPHVSFTDTPSFSTSDTLSTSDSLRLDKLTRSLRLFARLRQPFGALLLAPLSHNEYKRVASDVPIVVQLRKDVTPRYLAQKIRTLDIL